MLIKSEIPISTAPVGGNAGLGCVHAAVTLGCPATIVVPKSTTDFMISKLRAAGAAEVIQHGKSWAEADGYLTKTVLPEARERGENAVYVHPFDAQAIWDGHATLIHDIDGQLSQNEDSGALVNGNATAKLDAVICSVGGGGLLCGIMQGLEETNNLDTQVIAMETKGADSLAQSLQQGKLVTLPAITSIATSLGARTVAKRAFEYGQQHNVTSVVVSDAQAVRACARFADDERILVEPACGVCMSICYEDRLKKAIPGLNSHSNVVIVVCCGSNVSLEILADWQRDFQD